MAMHATGFVMANGISMKRGRRLLFLALAAGGILWCAAPHRADAAINIALPNAGISTISDPNDALRSARQHILAHDLQGAVYLLERYVTNHPEEGAVERFLGDLYVSNGDLPDAEALYKRLLLDYPLNHDLHSGLGFIYMLENRTDASIEQFDDSLPDVESVYYLVLLHQRKGDLASFGAGIRRLADAHPDDADIQIEAAQFFGALYLPRDAAIDFQRALAIYPKSLSALEGLGLAQTAEGAYAAADQTLQTCLTVDPESYGCLNALGMLYIQESRLDDAETTLQRAYQLAPEQPQALVSLARVYEARAQWQDAIAWYQHALYVMPYSADAYVGIAFDEEELGDLQKAKATTLSGLAVAPDDARLHYMLGYLYRKFGQRNLALTEFLAAEQSLDPDIARFAKESAAALQQP